MLQSDAAAHLLLFIKWNEYEVMKYEKERNAKKRCPTDIYSQNSSKTEQQQQEQCSAIHYYGFHGILCMIWGNNLKYERNYCIFHEYKHFMHEHM